MDPPPGDGDIGLFLATRSPRTRVALVPGADIEKTIDEG
jgi:hypothetical protein